MPEWRDTINPIGANYVAKNMELSAGRHKYLGAEVCQFIALLPQLFIIRSKTDRMPDGLNVRLSGFRHRLFVSQSRDGGPIILIG